MNTDLSPSLTGLAQNEAPDIRHFISGKGLTVRWGCSRSTADRIAVRIGLTRYTLGDGRGIVRYLLSEVEAYEDRRAQRLPGACGGAN